jgi:hypothetical protein
MQQDHHLQQQVELAHRILIQDQQSLTLLVELAFQIYQQAAVMEQPILAMALMVGVTKQMVAMAVQVWLLFVIQTPKMI